MLPTFSIIVPTHARPVRLRSCLASLADLDYDRNHFEIIVVDDGTNPPRPIAEAVDTVRDRVEITLIPQARGGPAAARNRGGRSASNEVLAFTDDDCRPQPRWLRALAMAWDDKENHRQNLYLICLRQIRYLKILSLK